MNEHGEKSHPVFCSGESWLAERQEGMHGTQNMLSSNPLV